MHKDYLVVEDSTERLKKINQFILIGKNGDIAFNAQEAINHLTNNTYDYIFLDHDLEPEHYNGKFGKGTGQEVVDWIVQYSPKISLIIIHSLNPVGADNMYKSLRNYYKVKKLPGFWDGRYGGEEQILS